MPITTTLTIPEATSLLHSHGIKCDKQLVEQWIAEGKLKGTENGGTFTVEEDEVYEFLHLYQYEGTAYEKGIDDQTKIKRLLEEISDYKQEKEELLKEIRELKEHLSRFGVMPF